MVYWRICSNLFYSVKRRIKIVIKGLTNLFLWRFYNGQSSFVHGGVDSGTDAEVVRGQQEIHQKILQLNLKDCHAKISKVCAVYYYFYWNSYYISQWKIIRLDESLAFNYVFAALSLKYVICFPPFRLTATRHWRTELWFRSRGNSLTMGNPWEGSSRPWFWLLSLRKSTTFITISSDIR